MFHELCSTGRTHHLARIHRFHQPWEAAASLKLRHGDPAAIDTYIRHGRVHPGEFDEHLEHIARLWLNSNDHGRTIAVTAGTNTQVDAINDTVQTARAAAGQLDTTVTASIGHGQAAHPRDVIVTRRNNRQIHTTTGEPIRNRELWTITNIHDGALHVTSRHGTGNAVLPADYVAEHVQLGYAATEHGNQSDTVDIGIELVTAATGRRGLYVGATRGRDTNQLLVVTNDHDPDTARDLLHTVLANDRADIPATAQHRNLAQADLRPTQPTPRCQIPAWFPQLQREVHQDLAAARTAVASDRQRITDLEHDLADARRQVAVAERNLEPYQPGLAAADCEVASARDRQFDAYSRLRGSGRLGARAARRDVAAADQAYEAAVARRRATQAVARPAQDRSSQVHARVHSIEAIMRRTHTLHQWNGNSGRAEHLEQLAKALNHWQQWAHGQPVRRDVLSRTVDVLRQHVAARPACAQLIPHISQQAARTNIRRPVPAAHHVDRGIGLER